MLIKWNDEGAKTPQDWHIADGISQVTYHGRMSSARIADLVIDYDGVDAEKFYNIVQTDHDASEWYDYLVVYFSDPNRDREHWLMRFGVLYVLSNEGKTVDKFFP